MALTGALRLSAAGRGRGSDSELLTRHEQGAPPEAKIHYRGRGYLALFGTRPCSRHGNTSGGAGWCPRPGRPTKAVDSVAESTLARAGTLGVDYGRPGRLF